MPLPAPPGPSTNAAKENRDLESMVSATSRKMQRHRKGSGRLESGGRRRCMLGKCRV
jgi:hypothetical protein